jgi:hypothetical protein
MFEGLFTVTLPWWQIMHCKYHVQMKHNSRRLFANLHRNIFRYILSRSALTTKKDKIKSYDHSHDNAPTTENFQVNLWECQLRFIKANVKLANFFAIMFKGSVIPQGEREPVYSLLKQLLGYYYMNNNYYI